MPESTLTNDDKMRLLTEAGIAFADAHLSVFGAPPTTIAEQPEPDEPIAPAPAAVVVNSDPDVSAVAQSIIATVHADKSAALRAADSWGTTWFDANKVSKQQAAMRQINDKSAYNKALHAQRLDLVSAIKSVLKTHYGEQSLRTAIAARTPSLNVSDEAMSRLVAMPEFAALLAAASK